MATVYDKSSLFLAPSGVSNGTVFTQKPAPIYGPELVANGDFATDSDWAKTGNVTIAGGVATFDDGGSNTNTFLQQNVLTTAKKYLITLDIKRYAAGRLQIVAGSDIYSLDISQGVGSYQIQTNAVNSATLRVKRDGSYPNFDFDIDNVSAKEVLVDDADFTFSRGSNLSATRVNADGLIEKGRENIVLHSNDFSQSSWAKLNGASVSSTQVADPFGGTNAWELTFATNNDSRIQQQVTTVNNTVYAFSVWARVTSGTKIVNLGAVGNLQQKTLTTTWQRIQAHAKEIDAYGFPQIRKHSAEGEYTIQIYGFQLELGTAATDYIGSAATTGKAGLLENTPRLDYSGGATCPSLLLEPSRTQLVPYSEYINTSVSSWSSFFDTTITNNDAVSPDGTNNATRITNSGSSARLDAIVSSLAIGTYTYSFYAKGDVTSLSVNVYQESGGATLSSTPIQTLINGSEWKRVKITFTTTAVSSIRFIYGGPAASESYLIWGAQLELGSYATSYIPNHSGGTITRSQDSASVLSRAQSFPLTAYIEIDVFSISDYNQFQFRQDPSNYVLRVGNQIIVGATYSLANTLGSNKIALSVDASGNFKLFRNGTSLSTGTITGSIDEIRSDAAGYEVKQILLFPTALSDTDCEILTGATTYETFEEMALALNYTVYE